MWFNIDFDYDRIFLIGLRSYSSSFNFVRVIVNSSALVQFFLRKTIRLLCAFYKNGNIKAFLTVLLWFWNERIAGRYDKRFSKNLSRNGKQKTLRNGNGVKSDPNCIFIEMNNVCKEFKNNTLHTIISLNFLLKNKLCATNPTKVFWTWKKIKNWFSSVCKIPSYKNRFLFLFLFLLQKKNFFVQKTATFTSSTMCVQNT